MKIEREKKYLIPKDLVEKLIRSSILKIGVIQWYIDKPGFITDERLLGFKKLRLRLTFDDKLNKNWVIAIKKDLRKFEREEIEFGIDDSIIKLKELKNFRLTAKIRYFITKPHSDPEIVLDEFLNNCGVKFDINYLLEVESQFDFEEIEKEYGLENFEVKDFNAFTNERLAKKFNIDTKDLIECLYKKLKNNNK